MSTNNTVFENYLGQIYPVELEIKDTMDSNTSASCLDLLLSIGRDGQFHTPINHKRERFPFSNYKHFVHESQYFIFARIWRLYLQPFAICPGLLLKEQGDFPILVSFSNRDTSRKRLKLSLRKFYCRNGDDIKQYEVPLS